MLILKAFENDNYYESFAYCFTKDEDDNEESSVFKEMHSIPESVVAAVKDFMDSVDACIESDDVPVNSEVPGRLSSLKAHLSETKTWIDECHVRDSDTPWILQYVYDKEALAQMGKHLIYNAPPSKPQSSPFARE
ncbi:hypothetical protein HK104_006778 [Borealophlyctis nickersoniae]|nr:hypothetical protein HK104_006778 [Borealophlyctis nickersoniae]